jgi:hypothetical protein
MPTTARQGHKPFGKRPCVPRFDVRSLLANIQLTARFRLRRIRL